MMLWLNTKTCVYVQISTEILPQHKQDLQDPVFLFSDTKLARYYTAFYTYNMVVGYLNDI